MKKYIFISVLILQSIFTVAQFNVAGSADDSITAGPLINARITLFNIDTTFFREERTDANGDFQFTNIPANIYSLGVASSGMEYIQISLIVINDTSLTPIEIPTERNAGIWQTIVQSPEALGGTDLGILMPDGKIFYCHSTKDPCYFNPLTNDTMSFIGDTAVQGCVGPILMPNGLMVMAGGTLQDVYGPGTRRVKTYDYLMNTWDIRNSLLDYRWYPSITKLADNRLLICGGGNLSNPVRTNSSEVYNTSTWTSQFTDTLAIGNEVSPIVLLHNGKVLMTHRPPQLFDPSTLQWDSAGQFVQSPRMPNGDHADHELVMLSDGDVLAIGYKSFTPGLGSFIERYNPASNAWTQGSSINPIRSRSKTVLLPNEKILVMAGYKEDANDTTSTNQWGYMNLCDEYDPSTDSWRRLSRMNLRREYHCNTILVPDGRVIAVGGEGQPGNEPPFSYFEGFNPPYLFRGVRPTISNLSTTDIERGENFSFDVNFTDSLTSVVLYSLQAVTHFMNSGNNRFVRLPFTQSGTTIFSSLLSDSLMIPDGHYMMFAMVDDIPSIAKIITVNGSFITSISSLDYSEEFLIYPNPTSGNFSFINPEKLNGGSIVLMDLFGKVIIQWTASLNSTFNISDVAAGIYLLQIKSGNNIQTQKLIVIN